MMEEVRNYADANGIRLMGSPFTIYHKFDVENGTSMFSVGYPVSERVITDEKTNVLVGFKDRGRYYKTVLKGSYDYSEQAWQYATSQAEQAKDYAADEDGEPFEIYVNLPEETPNPADLVTEIYIPVKLRTGQADFTGPDI